MAWLYYRSITIAHGQVGSGGVSNYPVLFSGTYAGGSGALDLRVNGSGGPVTNASGFDIGFYSDSALTTKLSWETELYVGSTGQVIYWVKIPSISSSSDTIIYIAYGNTAITTDQSAATSVWDANFTGVWHCQDNAATATVLDSTSNAHNGTAQGVNTSSLTTASGQSHLGRGFTNFTNAHYISTAYAPPTTFTYSGWVTGDGASDSSYQNRPFGFGDFLSGHYGSSIIWGFTGSGGNTQVLVTMRTAGSSADYTYSTASPYLQNGTWHYIVCVMDGSAGTIVYWDGNQVGTNSALTAVTITGNFTLGRDPNQNAGAFGTNPGNGTIDEVRISSTTRNAAWVTTDYNNQSAPSSFYTIGSQTIVPQPPVGIITEVKQAITRASYY